MPNNKAERMSVMPEFLEVAVEAVRTAGAIQRANLKRPIKVRAATHHDVKLQTDVDCEEAIRALLQRAFPDHAILGEEGGGAIAADVPTWIVDPLDGTANYARRLPFFCASVALQVDGKVVAGAVYQPITDELFTATVGGGAYLNGTPIAVSTIDNLGEAVVAVGCGKSTPTIDGLVESVQRLAYATHKIRILGAAALELCYLAAGRIDGFLERGLRTWDIAAGSLLVTEAGGRCRLTPAGEYAWDVLADNGRLGVAPR